MKRIVFAVPLVALGSIIGLLVTDRVSTRPSETTPQRTAAPAQTRASLPPAGTLPDLSDVAERAIQASVNISSTVSVRVDPFFLMLYGGDSVRADTTLGSGVVVSSDGYVLTNSHVVGRGAQIKVTLPDSRELPAKVVGVDPVSDLALVKVSATGLTPLPWGDSDKLRVAEWVLAIGNPFAFSQTVTLGIVSAKSRHAPQLGSYADMIQTDAAINPGNSGGALVNKLGELIGINTMIYSETGSNTGLGFAIPANFARQIMDDLKANGEVARGDIGLGDLRTVTPAAAERAGLGRISGVLVDSMLRVGSANRAGVRLSDIIVRVDGKAITDVEQFQRLILDAKIGSTVKVDVLRNGRPLTIAVPVEKAVQRR
jgi:S1-C subfamily serine protease